MYIPSRAISEDKEEIIMNFEKQNSVLFQKISDEIQAKVKEGIDEQSAMIQVMAEYEDELRQAMRKDGF
jgi:hypothetical protein